MNVIHKVSMRIELATSTYLQKIFFNHLIPRRFFKDSMNAQFMSYWDLLVDWFIIRTKIFAFLMSE